MDQLKTDGLLLLKDFKALGSNVLQPDQTTLYKTAGMMGTIALFSLTDRTVRSSLKRNTSDFNRELSKIDRFYGDRTLTVISLFSLYTIGLAGEFNSLRSSTRQAIQATLYTGLYSELIKLSAGRRRPYAADSPWQFRPFSGLESEKSLPSGHVAITFAISTVYARQVDHVLWKLGWYGGASLVAFARIYRDKHWLSDTMLGALLGHSIGRFVTDKHPNIQAGYSDECGVFIKLTIELDPQPDN
jgi:hypothetical protein